MITKHSADGTSVKPFQIGLRLARVVSIGNGTVDVCPIGSSVVLHDIPVTSATTMTVGDVINLQVMDNKRFAFASQNADASSSIVTNNVTIQNGDINIAGEGGSGLGTITGVSGGYGLTGSGNSGAVVLDVGAGNGISVDTNSVSVNVLSNGGISVGANGVYLASSIAGDGLNITSGVLDVDSTVVRTTRTISAGNGLTGGGNLSADRTLSIALATISGLTTTSGLAIKPATGGSAIAIDASGVFLNSSLAGDGLSMTSQVLDVNPGNGIQITGDAVAIKPRTSTGLSGLTANTDGLYVNAGNGLVISSPGNLLNVNPGNGISVSENFVSATPDTSKGISVGNSGIAINLAGTSGLNFTSGQLRIGQGYGIAVDTSSIRAVALTNGGLLVGEGGISVVAGNGILVSAGVSAKANAEKAVVVESAGIGVVANALLGIAVSSSGVGINKKDTASGLRFDASDGTKLGLDLADPSGLSFSSNGLQLDNSIAGDGLTIGNKIISVATSLTSLTIGANSVDVNYAHMFPWTSNHTWNTSSSIASTNTVSGFAGQGWQIRTKDNTLGTMDLDELTVRGKLRVYELLIQQIRATNGSIFVSSSAKVALVTETGIGTGEYTITIDAKNTDFCPFAVGDLLRAQRVDLGKISTGSSEDIVWKSDLTVTAVNGLSFTATLRTETTVPAVGMDYVRLGNTTDSTRRSSLYLTSDDSSAPYIDVVTGVSAFTGTSGWGTGVRARIGRLDGVTSGSDEFGIWAGTGMGVNNRYIRVSSTIAEFRNVPIELFGNTGTVAQVRLTAGGSNDTPSFAMGTTIPTSSLQPAGSGVWMGQETAGGSYTFRVGAVASGALTNGILWDGSTLTVTGAINVVAGGNAETTSGAQSKATTAQTTAINTASSDATTKANSAQTTAISTAASDATSKSNTAQSNAQSYSDTELEKVVNKATGKLAFSFATAPTGTGLYLGSSHLGYYNGGWKTYMDNSGNFYLNGTSGTQGLTWTTSTNTLAIDGAITAQSGNIAGVLTIGASGAIRQGTGTWASTFTGLNIDQENSRGRIRFFDNNSVRGVFGNLASTYDYAATALYGLAIGSYTGSWISADPTYGFRVMNSTTKRFQVDSTGNVSIGNPSGTTPYITIDTTNGIRAIDSATTQFQVDISGNVTIGSSTGNNVYITGTGLNIRRGSTNALSLTSTSMTINNSSGNAVISLDNSGSASVAGVLNIGTGGEIRQGTGSLTASPATFTGTRMWNDGGVGRIGGYNTGALQWYAGTDGKLYAGSGNIELSSSGIKLKSAVSALSYSAGLNFVNSVDGSSLASLGYDSNDDALKVYLNGSTSTFLVESFYAVGGSNSSIVVKGGSPFIAWVGKDSSTNTKTWDAGVSTNYWYLRALNDAGTTYNTVLVAGRTTATNTVSTFDINSTAISLNGSVTSSSTYLTLIKDTEITKSSPFLRFWSTDSVANNRRWDIGVTAYTLLFRLYNDANNSGATWFTATRSANTISSISIVSSSTSFSGDVSANDGVFTGGLNVGTATGAGVGAIKASAGLIATTGAFSSTLSATTGTFSSTISTGAGLNVGSTILGAGNGDIAYTGDLTASRTSNYTGYIYVPNTAYTNLTDTGSTAWSGAATRAVGNYQINLTANGNGFNAAIKAVVLAVRGSWTTASASNRLNIREWTGTGTGGTNQIIVTAQAANIPIDNVGVVNVGSSSSIVVEVAGASVSSGLIRVIGYYI